MSIESNPSRSHSEGVSKDTPVDTFSTPLGEVQDHLPAPDDASMIDPHTNRVDYSPISEEEKKELARLRGIEASRDAIKKRQKRTLGIVAGSTAGALVLGLGGYFLGRGNDSSSERPNPAPIEEELGDPGNIAVDGNEFPQLANKEYDDLYGIYELGTDGEIANPEQVAKKWGLTPNIIVSTEEAEALNMSFNEAMATNPESLPLLRSTIDEKLLPQMTAFLDALNMNNPTAQFYRAEPIEDLEQKALLSNAALSDKINNLFLNQSALSADPLMRLMQTEIPNDPALRAVISPLGKDIDAAEYQSADGENMFFRAAPDGLDIRSTYIARETVPYPTEAYSGSLVDATFEIAWVDADDNVISRSTVEVPMFVRPRINSEGNPDETTQFKVYDWIETPEITETTN